MDFLPIAARLFAHNLTAVIQGLKQSRAFHARYHAEKGTGIGERNALSGLAPAGLFLKILGVEIISPTRLKLEGTNPFPFSCRCRHVVGSRRLYKPMALPRRL